MTIEDEIRRIKERLSQDFERRVRIALAGQPGSGKSSLVNAIVGRKVMKTSPAGDGTREEQETTHDGITFVDLPGWGTKLFPAEGFFERFKLASFDVFLCVTGDPRLRADDVEFFGQIKRLGKPCLYVRSKSDTIYQPDLTLDAAKDEIVKNLRSQLGDERLEVHFVTVTDRDPRRSGIQSVVDAVHSSLDKARAARWAIAAKARSAEFLLEKREACLGKARLTAALVAASTAIPIPGADIAVDLGLLLRLLGEIRDSYGLDESTLNSLGPMLANVASRVASVLTREGLLLALKSFAGKATFRQFAKWAPIVGPLVAAGVGYWLTVTVAEGFVDDCHKLAEAVLERELHPQS